MIHDFRWKSCVSLSVLLQNKPFASLEDIMYLISTLRKCMHAMHITDPRIIFRSSSATGISADSVVCFITCTVGLDFYLCYFFYVLTLQVGVLFITNKCVSVSQMFHVRQPKNAAAFWSHECSRCSCRILK